MTKKSSFLAVFAKKDRIIMVLIREICLPREFALWDSEALSHWGEIRG